MFQPPPACLGLLDFDPLDWIKLYSLKRSINQYLVVFKAFKGRKIFHPSLLSKKNK